MNDKVFSSFSRLVRFPILIALALASVVVRSSVSAELEQRAALDLIGMIQAKDAQPINSAHVFIYTAGPRVGTSPI